MMQRTASSYPNSGQAPGKAARNEKDIEIPYPDFRDIMAEPLSFVASIIAVATLAENVVTKGYRYIKAVKNCPEHVRNLVAEVDVLCGILSRLAKFLRHSRGLTPQKTAKLSRKVHSVDHFALDPAEALEPPDFIRECQKSLEKIQDILNGFGRQDNRSSHPSSLLNRFSRLKIPASQRLELKDLGWPLALSETMELIQELERHKATCTIALAANGVVGVHAVLKQVKLSNKYLAEIQAKQESLLEMHLSQKEENALTWLSPENPAFKYQAFKRERMGGTGTWFFDLSETLHWLDGSTDALWVYGIPGAGKTTLSTLIVDKVLAAKRTPTVGTAYFYVRHDDKESHKPSNLLGSLISQLARQNPEALADVMTLYAQHSSQGSLGLPPDDRELNGKLHDIIQHFTKVYFLVDGLDECGSLFNPDRQRLVEVIAEFHGNDDRAVQTMVFSRDEPDIRQKFHLRKFHAVSIAATSGDLRLFTNAWLGRLDVQSNTLRSEIGDTLVREAGGMFMWVRAQVDYLQRLPTDSAKRAALSQLPPDLTRTYIRIFETIDANYPLQTRIYIQRALKWIVFDQQTEFLFSRFRKLSITDEELCQAISVENEKIWPTEQTRPTESQIYRWLGCLIDSPDHEEGRIRFSHYTVREFLRIDPVDMANPIVRQFLVRPEDRTYIVNVCLRTVMNEQLQRVQRQTEREKIRFRNDYYFYEYACKYMIDYLHLFQNFDIEGDRLIRTFLKSSSLSFGLWSTSLLRTSRGSVHSPLHFAARACLKRQLEELLDSGANPNSANTLQQSSVTPLHTAIAAANLRDLRCDETSIGITKSWLQYRDFDYSDAYYQGSMDMTRTLIEAGADINQQTRLENISDVRGRNAIITPLVLALLCNNGEMASHLLRTGADWKANKAKFDQDSEAGKAEDLCSLDRFLKVFPNYYQRTRHAAQLADCADLLAALDEWYLTIPEGTRELTGL
ncbi:MAG: hypothetical protein Q9181_007245 [Wetmoreana brouardii]